MDGLGAVPSIAEDWSKSFLFKNEESLSRNRLELLLLFQ
jgi:hypothetical protein